MQRLPIDFVQPVKAFVLFVTFAILFYKINTIEEKVGYNSRDKYLINIFRKICSSHRFPSNSLAPSKNKKKERKK